MLQVPGQPGLHSETISNKAGPGEGWQWHKMGGRRPIGWSPAAHRHQPNTPTLVPGTHIRWKERTGTSQSCSLISISMLWSFKKTCWPEFSLQNPCKSRRASSTKLSSGLHMSAVTHTHNNFFFQFCYPPLLCLCVVWGWCVVLHCPACPQFLGSSCLPALSSKVTGLHLLCLTSFLFWVIAGVEVK